VPTPMYEHKDGRIYQRHQLETGSKLLITSRDIRRERTGVHACVEIFMNQVVLAYDTFNIDRNEERVRLANSAHVQMSEMEKTSWTKADMKHALDEFLIGLWREHLNLAATSVDDEYDTSPSLPDFVLEPYVLAGAGTIMFGPPERGKSTTALLMAMCVDAGLSWPWRAPRAVPTLYINLERSAASMYRRVGRIQEAIDLPDSYRLPMLNARGRSLLDISEAVREIIKRRNVGFIVLDSISRAGYGDLNDNQVGNKVADVLNAFEVAWLAIGHTPRGDETHLFGSQMFDAAADVMLGMMTERAEDGTLGVGLKVSKANDMPWPPMQTWAYEFNEFGLCKVRSANDGEFWDLEGADGTPRQRLERFLLAYGEASIDEAATALGMPYQTAARLLRDSENKNLVQCRFEPNPKGGRPRKLYSVPAKEGANGGFSHLINTREKGSPTPLGGLERPGDKNPPDKNPPAPDGGWEPCAGCRRALEPERYTPDGRPLCVVCAEDYVEVAR